MQQLFNAYMSHMTYLHAQFGHITCIHALARRMNFTIKLGEHTVVSAESPATITFSRDGTYTPDLGMWQIAYLELERLRKIYHVDLTDEHIDFACRMGAKLLLSPGLEQPCPNCVFRIQEVEL